MAAQAAAVLGRLAGYAAQRPGRTANTPAQYADHGLADLAAPAFAGR
ncbi:hypothetical protein ACRAWF_28145 [Streptomyces sp. L7]